MTQNLERLLVVAKEKERMEAEIEIARECKDQLYPKAPAGVREPESAGMLPSGANGIGAITTTTSWWTGKLAIAIGDVAGKGISAALLMATIQAAMRMELRASVDMAAPSMNGLRFSTARMVSELNQQLHATTSPEKYATFFFAIFDQARVCSLIRMRPFAAGSVSRWRGNSSGCQWHRRGAFPFSTYEESKLELRSGDLLVCYTDGITEPGERVWRNVRGRAPD